MADRNQEYAYKTCGVPSLATHSSIYSCTLHPSHGNQKPTTSPRTRNNGNSSVLRVYQTIIATNSASHAPKGSPCSYRKSSCTLLPAKMQAPLDAAQPQRPTCVAAAFGQVTAVPPLRMPLPPQPFLAPSSQHPSRRPATGKYTEDGGRELGACRKAGDSTALRPRCNLLQAQAIQHRRPQRYLKTLPTPTTQVELA